MPVASSPRLRLALAGALLPALLLASGMQAAAQAHDDHAHGDHAHGDHAHDDHAHDEHTHDGHAHDHVHGLGLMRVTINGYMLEAELTLPGCDLFQSDDDAAHTAEAAAARVPAATALFAIPEAAGCAPATSDVAVSEIAEGDHAGHTDWTLAFGLVCAEPAALTALNLSVFDTLPDLEGVRLTVEGDRFRLEADVGPGTGPVTLRPFGDAQGS